MWDPYRIKIKGEVTQSPLRRQGCRGGDLDGGYIMTCGNQPRNKSALYPSLTDLSTPEGLKAWWFAWARNPNRDPVVVCVRQPVPSISCHAPYVRSELARNSCGAF